MNKDNRVESVSTLQTIINGLVSLYEFTIGDLLKIFSMFKEVGNYFFIGRTLKKMSTTKDWNKFKMKRGYFNVAYTIINLPPEVFESEQTYWQIYVIEAVKPINDWFATQNLQDVVRMKLDDISNADKGEYAFLVRYFPLFRDLSIGYFVKWALVGLVLWWANMKFGILHGVSAFIHWLTAFVKI